MFFLRVFPAGHTANHLRLGTSFHREILFWGWFMAFGLPHGYGSIPTHTIFRGMNIHLPAISSYFDVHQGYKVLTHCHMCAYGSENAEGLWNINGDHSIQPTLKTGIQDVHVESWPNQMCRTFRCSQTPSINHLELRLRPVPWMKSLTPVHWLVTIGIYNEIHKITRTH